jgi:hypothetical protein
MSNEAKGKEKADTPAGIVKTERNDIEIAIFNCVYSGVKKGVAISVFGLSALNFGLLPTAFAACGLVLARRAAKTLGREFPISSNRRFFSDSITGIQIELSGIVTLLTSSPVHYLSTSI